MEYIGDFRTGKTVTYSWATNGAAGESITRATNGSLRVYKNSSTTERSSSAGITDTEDFDSLTGVHDIAIDTSDNTDSGFYAAGNDYKVVLVGAVIDGETVNYPIFSFSIENRSALMPTTDGRKLDVSTGGEAGTDWANIGSPTTTVALSGTTVKTATDVETDTADIQSKLGTPAGASLAADIAAIKAETAATVADTNELQTDWANGGRLDLILDARASQASVDTIDGIVDSILADTAEMQGDLANGGRLDLIFDATLADTNELQTDWADGGRLDLILDARASQSSVDTIDGIADAILADTAELQADWANGGRLDLLLDTAASAGSLTAEAIRTEMDSNSTKLAAIVADTNELQVDWVNGGRLDLLIDSIISTIGTSGVVVAAGSKTGYSLAAAGMDAVLVESGITAGASLTDDAGSQLTSINARQALALAIAVLSGVLSGGGSSPIIVKPAGKPTGNTRVSATTPDDDGNRTALTIKVPT